MNYFVEQGNNIFLLHKRVASCSATPYYFLNYDFSRISKETRLLHEKTAWPDRHLMIPSPILSHLVLKHHQWSPLNGQLMVVKTG